MQYVFFNKGIRSVQRDLGQSPRDGRIFENFGVTEKSYRENWGAGWDVLCSPNNFVAPPVPAPMPYTNASFYPDLMI